VYGINENGSGYKSGLENRTAVDCCAADSTFMTMWDDRRDSADLRAVAIRDGMRREKDTMGYGSSAMEVNDDRVAPWYLGDDVPNKLDVTTATGWAVSRSSERRRSRVTFSCVVLRYRACVTAGNPREDIRNI